MNKNIEEQSSKTGNPISNLTNLPTISSNVYSHHSIENDRFQGNNSVTLNNSPYINNNLHSKFNLNQVNNQQDPKSEGTNKLITKTDINKYINKVIEKRRDTEIINVNKIYEIR